MFAKNLFRGLLSKHNFVKQGSTLLFKKSQQQSQQQWKLYTLAALGFSVSTYCFNQNISLDGFYEVTIPADFKDGEKRGIQVGPKEQDTVLVVKTDGKYYCVSNACTHYGFGLSKGQLFDDKVTCPLHMAQFSVKTGEHEYGPVFKGLETFEITEKDGQLHIKVDKDRLNKARSIPMVKKGNDPRRFVIIGGGVAGLSAAETLRQSGFEGEITILSSEKELPYDRTALSKNMNAQLGGISIRSADFLKEYDINFITESNVDRIDTNKNYIQTSDGKHMHYEKLLVASGARPRIPPVANSGAKGVHAVRTFEDVQELKAQAKQAKNIVIAGASFIGLESASALKDFLKGQNVNITVCDVTKVPYARVLGEQVGNSIKKLHEDNGINFVLETKIDSIETNAGGQVSSVKLSNGEEIPADIVVFGTGVQPNTEFVKDTLKLSQDGGIQTDIFHKVLNQQNVYAAGDVSTYPWWYTGQNVRIEHYNEAIHQGYVAALNMLGKQVPNDNIPFFWTRFHGKSLAYTGHALQYDDVHVEGDVNAQKFLIYYLWNNQVVGAASMGQMNSVMIINEAMKQNIAPRGSDLKSGRVTLQDLEAKVKAKGHKCKCRRRGNCSKNQNTTA